MTRYLLVVEYDGTDFFGFQKQPGLPTVQGALEEALVALTGEEISVYGSGRTDAGVHAIGQAAAFDLPGRVGRAGLVKSLNALLPPGVCARSASVVQDGFDPRREAFCREYRYFILNGEAPSALLDRYSHHVPAPLDRASMGTACSVIVGEHDFSAFCVGKAEGPVRTVFSCGIEETGFYPGLLCLVVRGNSFLHKMVRIIAGAVVRVGQGKMSADELARHLDGGEVPCATPLPARGLFLWAVCFPGEESGGIVT